MAFLTNNIHQGTELEFSGLQIEYKADIHKSEYCKIELDDANLKAFLYAGQNFAFDFEFELIFWCFQ